MKNRKTAWTVTGSVLGCLILVAPTFGATGIPVPEMAACDTTVETFLQDWNIPGATLATAKDGRLVYMRAFGVAGPAPPRRPVRFTV